MPDGSSPCSGDSAYGWITKFAETTPDLSGVTATVPETLRGEPGRLDPQSMRTSVPVTVEEAVMVYVGAGRRLTIAPVAAVVTGCDRRLVLCRNAGRRTADGRCHGDVPATWCVTEPGMRVTAPETPVVTVVTPATGYHRRPARRGECPGRRPRSTTPQRCPRCAHRGPDHPAAESCARPAPAECRPAPGTHPGPAEGVHVVPAGVPGDTHEHAPRVQPRERGGEQDVVPAGHQRAERLLVARLRESVDRVLRRGVRRPVVNVVARPRDLARCAPNPRGAPAGM